MLFRSMGKKGRIQTGLLGGPEPGGGKPEVRLEVRSNNKWFVRFFSSESKVIVAGEFE